MSSNKKLEEYIVLKSILDQSLSKLEDQDVVVFKGITKDVFMGTSVEGSTDQIFKKDLLESFRRSGL